MNKKILWVVIAAALVTAGSFFIYKKFFDTSNLVAHIPKNAAFVVTADFKSLSGKVNYEKLKNMNFMQEMKKQAQHRTKEETEFMNTIMQDPFGTGINFLKDAYAFGVGKNGGQAYGFVFEVTDAGDFEKFVKAIPGIDNLPQKQDGYTTMDLGHNEILAWDKNTGILITGLDEGKEKFANQLLTMEKSESVASLQTFRDFESSKHDFGAYIDYDGVMEMMGGFAKNIIPKEYDFSGVTVSMLLNFETNEVVLESAYSDPNGKLQKTNILADKGISSDMMGKITNGKVLGIGTFVFDPAKLFAYLKKNEEYSRNIDKAAEEIGVTASELENTFAGEVSVCATDLKNVKMTRKEYQYDPYTYESYTVDREVEQLMPMFIGSVSLKDFKLFNILMDKAKAEKTDKYWQLSDNGITAYFVQTKTGVTITNSLDAANEIAANGSFKASPQEPVKTLITDYPSAFFLDLNKDHYPKEGLAALEQQSGSRVYNMLVNAVKEMENISVSGSGTKSVFALNLKEGSENSLFRLINMIDEAALAN